MKPKRVAECFLRIIIIIGKNIRNKRSNYHVKFQGKYLRIYPNVSELKHEIRRLMRSTINEVVV